MVDDENYKRARLCRQGVARLDGNTGPWLADLPAPVADPERLAELLPGTPRRAPVGCKSARAGLCVRGRSGMVACAGHVNE